jgi:hypothetical protein
MLRDEAGGTIGVNCLLYALTLKIFDFIHRSCFRDTPVMLKRRRKVRKRLRRKLGPVQHCSRSVEKLHRSAASCETLDAGLLRFNSRIEGLRVVPKI